jgi:hypothetical protein
MYAFGLFSMVFQQQSGWLRQFPGSRDCVVGVANSLLSLPVIGQRADHTNATSQQHQNAGEPRDT